jgi:hypothetical protein
MIKLCIMQNIRIIDGDTKWFDEANCKGQSEVFFESVLDKPVDKRQKEKQAAAICAKCSVTNECKAYARRNGEHGFWGGESEDQRYAIGYLKDPVLHRRDRARRQRSIKNLQN